MTPRQVQGRLIEAGVWRSYTIAFSMRCGSTVLSQTLQSLGLGHPTEYFRYPYASSEYFAAYPASSVQEQFLRLAAGQVRDGWFGSKMSHDHRAHLDAHLKSGIDGYDGLDDVLPEHRWIFMRRRDVVAQAISLYVAEVRDQWHVAAGTPLFAEAPIRYDFFEILSKVMILATNNVNWESYFSAKRIRPHPVIYEDLASDPAAQLSAILKFLGVERDASTISLQREGGLEPMSKRSRSTYESLKGRFTEDFLRLGETGNPERLGPDLARWGAFFFGKGWRGSA